MGPINGHEDRIVAVLWTGMVQTMEEGRGQNHKSTGVGAEFVGKREAVGLLCA
jgi:hypothetical protein